MSSAQLEAEYRFQLHKGWIFFFHFGVLFLAGEEVLNVAGLIHNYFHADGGVAEPFTHELQDAVLSLTYLIGHHGIASLNAEECIGLDYGMAVYHAVLERSVMLRQLGCKIVPVVLQGVDTPNMN